MRIFKTLSLTFLFVALGATSSSAQQSAATDAGSTLSSADLATTLAGHESAVDQQRTGLNDVLSRDDVRDAALDRGVDMERVESAAAGLTDTQVRAVSPLVNSILQDGGGLGSVTIGVGLLIVILLILILVD